jgi:hypothetical protein
MPLTVHDIAMDADLFRAAYPNWPGAEPIGRPLPAKLEEVRLTALGAGFEATSPDKLSDEGERIAREERWTES